MEGLALATFGADVHNVDQLLLSLPNMQDPLLGARDKAGGNKSRVKYISHPQYRTLKQQHMNKYANEAETSPKLFQAVSVFQFYFKMCEHLRDIVLLL